MRRSDGFCLESQPRIERSSIKRYVIQMKQMTMNNETENKPVSAHHHSLSFCWAWPVVVGEMNRQIHPS